MALTDLVLGAAIGAVIAALFTEPAAALMARTVGRFFPANRKITGTWRSEYRFKSTQQGERDMVQTMRLSQLGTYVYGRCISDTEHRHVVRGRIRGDYLTGDWRSIVKGAGHFGSFQLYIRPTGRAMEGRYLGFDGDARIQSDGWHWTKA